MTELIDLIKRHKAIAIAVGVVLVFIGYKIVTNAKQNQPGATTGQGAGQQYYLLNVEPIVQGGPYQGAPKPHPGPIAPTPPGTTNPPPSKPPPTTNAPPSIGKTYTYSLVSTQHLDFLPNKPAGTLTWNKVGSGSYYDPFVFTLSNSPWNINQVLQWAPGGTNVSQIG